MKNSEIPKHLKKHMKKALKRKEIPVPSSEEKHILREISIRTRERNRNNVTRTMAYLDFYLEHPEIHWSLLAHLVSRNAGWNMTDLKGEHLSKLLTRKEQVDFFHFLERGNWLIFQDAYPQLLLFAKGKALGRSLSHLLPLLHVSSFMEPLWKFFEMTSSSSFITKALIINEQHYIENRVIQNNLYKKSVMDTILFKLQDLFDLNHILFPYNTPLINQRKIIGHTVHHFSSVKERIRLGQELYDLLFSVKSINRQITLWAEETPHTGSRKDFWPHLFNDIREHTPHMVRQPRQQPCGIHQGETRFYSPKLEDVWSDQQPVEAESGDWFKHLHALRYFALPIRQINGDIEQSYCDRMEKLEFSIFTKNSLATREGHKNT